jgi:hypothetical protein
MSIQAPSMARELALVMLLAGAVFIAIPLSLGGIGLGWDALNHHIYLGWVADQARFDRDYMAASYQSYQFPYLYWPVYKLAMADISGRWAGVVLASLNLLMVPPVWIVARACIPENTWFGAGMRMSAVALGLCSILVLSLFDSTSNDLLGAIPFVWAVALALLSSNQAVPGRLTASRATAASGLMVGAAVAFKLSNGPLALAVPVLWASRESGFAQRLKLVLVGGIAALAAFAMVYGYWGWQLWTHFGNPIYPFVDGWFASVRHAFGWTAL